MLANWRIAPIESAMIIIAQDRKSPSETDIRPSVRSFALRSHLEQRRNPLKTYKNMRALIICYNNSYSFLTNLISTSSVYYLFSSLLFESLNRGCDLSDRPQMHPLLINHHFTRRCTRQRERVEAILAPCPALTCSCWMRSAGWMRLGRMKITRQQSRLRMPFSGRLLGSLASMQILRENKFATKRTDVSHTCQ